MNKITKENLIQLDNTKFTEEEKKHLENGGRVFCVFGKGNNFQLVSIKKSKDPFVIDTESTSKEQTFRHAILFVNLSEDNPLIHNLGN